MTFDRLAAGARGVATRARQALRPPMPASVPAPIYLIGSNGWPNYGDEIITRSWLRYLARHRPETTVWLDCPQPGRAAMLFRDEHPRLRTTDTLWQLVGSSDNLPADERSAFIESKLIHLGSPSFDIGLEALRSMGSCHLVGGGYLNEVWPLQRLLVDAVAVLKQHFSVPAYATGAGFLPLGSESSIGNLAELLQQFDYVETRDQEGADTLGLHWGLDDAFLELSDPASIYSAQEDLPDVMIMVQGDFIAPERDEEVVHQIAEFAERHGSGPGSVGFVEAVPLIDLRFRTLAHDAVPGARFFTFVDLWRGGFPARPGQTWLSTRFHTHLLAAAAGAAGTYLDVHPGFYDVKHSSLLARGTGWTPSSLGSPTTVEPNVNPTFPVLAQTYSIEKARIAAELYARAR